MLRLHPTSNPDGQQGSVLLMPPPRRALRHALPVVLEGVLGPLIVFYLLLVLAGFRGALIAALTWSYVALGRRLLRRERVSMLLLFGTVLLTLRTVVAFVTGSAFLYFAQPTAGTVAISVALLVSALVGRRTGRTAHAQYRMPLHPWPSVLGLMGLGYVIYASALDPDVGRPSLWATALVIAVSAAYYWLVLRRRGAWVLHQPIDPAGPL